MRRRSGQKGDEWMDGRKVGRMDRCINGWMDGWMEVCELKRCFAISLSRCIEVCALIVCVLNVYELEVDEMKLVAACELEVCELEVCMLKVRKLEVC